MANRPYFVIEYGPGEGAEIQMTTDSLVFGRDSSSDYAIPNEKISRRHARVFIRDGRWMLEDLDSKNHTRLNNIKLEPEKPVPICDGDQIQLATQVALRFHDPAATLSDDSRVVTEGLWLDTSREDVYIHNRPLTSKLSPCQFAILALLFDKSRTKNTAASMEEIAAVGWPKEYSVRPEMIRLEMIDSEIYRLRQRLKELEPNHEFICSERGRGRKFVQLKED